MNRRIAIGWMIVMMALSLSACGAKTESPATVPTAETAGADTVISDPVVLPMAATDPTAVSRTGMIFEDIDTGKLSADEVARLSDAEIRWAIADIFALHHCRFEKEDSIAHYRNMSWYTAGNLSDAEIEAGLSAVEKANLKTLREERDYRKKVKKEALQETEAVQDDYHKKYLGKTLYRKSGEDAVWCLSIANDYSEIDLDVMGYWSEGSFKHLAAYFFEPETDDTSLWDLNSGEVKLNFDFQKDKVIVTCVSGSDYYFSRGSKIEFSIKSTEIPDGPDYWKETEADEPEVEVQEESQEENVPEEYVDDYDEAGIISESDLIGTWSLDVEYTMDHSVYTIRDMYGSAINYFTPYASFESDGSFEYYIGFEGGRGTYSLESDGVHIIYEDQSGGGTVQCVWDVVEDGKIRLCDNMIGSTYWVK